MLTPTLMLITPELAQSYLDNMVMNRVPNKNHVKRLSEDITNGRWVLTHQGIAFDDNGKLIDGQHRCMAIVKAQMAVMSWVTVGVSVDASRVAIDQGKNRSGAASLAMQGVTQSHFKAAVCRQIAVLTDGGRPYNATLTNAETGALYNQWQTHIDHYAGAGRFPAAYYAALVIWRSQNPTDADSFNDYVTSGIGCSATQAALKKKLDLRRSEGGSKAVSTLLSTVIAIENHISGKKPLGTAAKIRINLSGYKAFTNRFNLPFNKSLADYATSD